MRMPVLGEGVAENNVADVLSFDEHVGFADRKKFRVQFLPVHGQAPWGSWRSWTSAA